MEEKANVRPCREWLQGVRERGRFDNSIHSMDADPFSCLA
jgi:hypothetical protein